jgi:hypothetical protein
MAVCCIDGRIARCWGRHWRPATSRDPLTLEALTSMLIGSFYGRCRTMIAIRDQDKQGRNHKGLGRPSRLADLSKAPDSAAH